MDGNFSLLEPKPAPQQPTPIDHAHLGRYTMGLRDLEIEVLNLFAGQAPTTLSSLRDADSEKAWHMAAHTLKGSARAVGAWSLATLAEDAERAGHASPDRGDLVSRLQAALEVTTRYIAGLT